MKGIGIQVQQTTWKQNMVLGVSNPGVKCTKITAYIHVHEYRQVSIISRTLVGNTIVDHSDVVGASPVSAAPTTSSFST